MVFQRTRDLAVRNMRWGFGLLALLLLMFGLAFSWLSWQAEKTDAEQSLLSIAELGGKSMDSYFLQFQSAFELLGQQIRDGGMPLDAGRVAVLLKRFQQANSGLQIVNLIRPDGQILVSTGAVAGKALPFIGDAPTFKLTREALQKGAVFDLGQASMGVIMKEWAIPLHYGVKDEQGNLLFILHAALPLSLQQSLWRDLPLSENTAIGILRDDGYLLSRYPSPPEIDLSVVYGKPRTGSLINYLRQHGFPARGVAEGRANLADTDQVFAFHRLAHFPLNFFVTTPAANIRVSWWKQARYSFLLLFLLLAGFVLIYRWTSKRQLAWELEREQAERSSRLAASAMENTIEGIMILDAAGCVVSVNAGFSSITGYGAQEVVGTMAKIFDASVQEPAFHADMWSQLRAVGCWQGEIRDQRKNGDTFAELLSISAVRADHADITHYVAVLNDISRYKDYEERLEFLASHDHLTKLPNRTLLNDRIEEALYRAKRSAEMVCVMFIDLDNFKVVNDSLGHEIGDKLLQQIAAGLLHTVREQDTVARLGGDEFTIVLEQLHTTEEVALIAQKLLTSIAEPLRIDDHQLYISASIGISFFPQDGYDVATLLKHADTAMYRAKEEGRNRYKFFSREMNARAQEFMLMANSLHAALEKNQLSLEYQPRIDLMSGEIVGVEALARWDHPELGRVPPDKFIPLAEDTGLITSIGAWVMRTACLQGRAWLDAGYPLRIAVNLSARQFRTDALAKCILDAVEDAGYRLDLLDVEITESLMMHDPDSVKAILEQISGYGVKIAIDDFGTGYSSLSYLKQFPIDYVKIDKSFVRDIPHDPDSVSIVRTIIAMAKNLRLGLIAEGVETEQQHELLRAEGCEEAQGYLFSRPLTAAAVTALLDKRRAA